MILRGATGNKLKANIISGNRYVGLLLGDLANSNVPPDSFAKVGIHEPEAQQAISAVLKEVKAQAALALPTTGDLIFDNRIGVDFGGNNGFGNGSIGLVIGENAKDNCIGSCDPTIAQGGAGNTISGIPCPPYLLLRWAY